MNLEDLKFTNVLEKRVFLTKQKALNQYMMAKTYDKVTQTKILSESIIQAIRALDSAIKMVNEQPAPAVK